MNVIATIQQLTDFSIDEACGACVEIDASKATVDLVGTARHGTGSLEMSVLIRT